MVEEVKSVDSEEEHVNELKAMCQMVDRRAIATGCRPGWQLPKRQQQARVRRRAVDFYRTRQQQGSTLDAAAHRLGLRPRTLREWDHACRDQERPLRLLGRPRARSRPWQRNAVIELLRQQGPWTSVATLRQAFPAMARAELANLAWRYRRVLHARYHDTIRVCQWLVPGRIWAMDWAEPSEVGADASLPPVDGTYSYLLAVRDLASGYQIAWLPLREATAEAVQVVLAHLFRQHGAPLVLKCDNGSAFRAESTTAFLDEAGVVGLYSPPHWPTYNGAIEAGIGALKQRTEQQAARQGRIGIWTWDDVEAARQEANTTGRGQRWIGRTPIADIERVRWQLTMQRWRMDARVEKGIRLDEDLDHWQQAAVDRKAIDRALVECGYLLYSRRRIPLRLRSQKVTNIM